MMPVAGHPPPAHEAKAKAARQKEISVIFFIRSLGRVQQQIGMNRQSRRRAERAVAAAGRAPPENSQPKANRSRKPSEDGDSRKQVQSASGNRRGTGTAENRSNPRPETVGERGQPETETADRLPTGRDGPPSGAGLQPEAEAARSRSMKKGPCNPAYAGVARPLSVYKRTNSTWCPSSSDSNCRRWHRNHGP